MDATKTLLPARPRGFLIGCITGLHLNDGRCLCEADVRRLQAGGLDEADAVALILRYASSLLRAGSGDAKDVRDDTPKENFVCGHNNILANGSTSVGGGGDG